MAQLKPTWHFEWWWGVGFAIGIKDGEFAMVLPFWIISRW